MRILITGSRDWTDVTVIQQALLAFHPVDAQGFDRQDVEMPTLISGACKTGADRIAETVARFLGWTVERHPADWAKHGNRAGFVRNAEMVGLDPDVCLAFIKNGSAGATMTRNLAVKADVPTSTYTA